MDIKINEKDNNNNDNNNINMHEMTMINCFESVSVVVDVETLFFFRLL